MLYRRTDKLGYRVISHGSENLFKNFIKIFLQTAAEIVTFVIIERSLKRVKDKENTEREEKD